MAEDSAFYGLPEGTRGIFVGGGGSVRISRLLGVSRMTDMMLTGRAFDADESQQFAISNYRVADGAGVEMALALASKIASNAPLSNYAITQALPRIADVSASDGLFMESLVSSIAQGDEAARERGRAFLERRANKVSKQRPQAGVAPSRPPAGVKKDGGSTLFLREMPGSSGSTTTSSPTACARGTDPSRRRCHRSRLGDHRPHSCA